MPLEGARLVARARHAIAQQLGLPVTPLPFDPDLESPGACFVTLTLRGELRGCIGSLEPRRSLEDDVRANALAAAFHDPRFPALSRQEWPDIDLEVSVLGPAEYRICPDEAAALAWVRPGKDGVILQQDGRRATFLPQVWEHLPDPHRFLLELRRKAGMPTHAWPSDMQVGRYPVDKYTDRSP